MIKKNVENSGGTVRLGYSFNCSSTPKPTIDWDYTQTDGFHVTIGDSEITVVVDENDTGSNSRTLVITPYIDGDPCKDNRIQISQGAGDEPGECSFSITASPSTFDCEGGNISFTYEKVDEGEPTGCKIPLTAKTINGLVYNYSTMRLDATGDTLTFSHGTSPAPSGGGWGTRDVPTILQRALPYTIEKTWSVGSGYQVILKNNTSYYIPYNGKMKVVNGSINYSITYRPETGAGHWYYGATTGDTQDSNFLVPPNAQLTLTCSKENASGSGTYVAFSELNENDKDYNLHNNNGEWELVTATTTSATFKFDDRNITYGTKTFKSTYCGFSSDVLTNYKYISFDDPYSGHFKIVPVNIKRSVSNNWQNWSPGKVFNN